MATNGMYFSIDEYHERWRSVYAEMKKRGYEMAIVWGKGAGTHERSMDILYLTNFYSNHSGQEPDSSYFNARSFCAAILTNNEPPELFTDEFDPRFELMATDRHHGSLDPIKGLADALNERKIEGDVIWVGSDTLPVKYAKQLEAMTPKIDYIYDDDLVREVRRVKSPAELDMYREGGEIASIATTKMIEALIMGKTEAEAAGIAAKELLSRGASYERIAINHGDTIDHLERNPLYGYSLDAPEPGDLFHCVIYGPVWQGYWYDSVRSGVCGGKPTPEQKKLLDDMVAIMEDLQGNIRHGAKAHDIAKSAMHLQHDVLGYPVSGIFKNWPYYGHSNGCLWEPPFISTLIDNPNDTFEENMVGGAEAFTQTPGVGTAIAENNYIVKKDGIELILSQPLVWW